jgi:hypothetical protein
METGNIPTLLWLGFLKINKMFDTQTPRSAIWYEGTPRNWYGRIIIRDTIGGFKEIWACEHNHESYEKAGDCARDELIRRLQQFEE